MKTKIVLWGNNDKEEKVLIAIELLETENQVRVITFSEEVATEEFYNQMMNLWREGQPVPFPENHIVEERPLSMTESLLPDHLKTMRADILTRAKTEWHFVVLSAKLYSSYIDEIQEFQQRIRELNGFDSGIWEEMKTFWTKVQHQVREKNLFKEHANDLRSKTNSLFDSLKTLKKALDEEFEALSKEHLTSFLEKLQNIEERIEKGLGLQPIFNELKGLQRKFRDTNFTRKDRSEVWKRLDGAFKLVKEKKFGKKQGDSTALSRINRRYQGLLSAISKMETSINRDKKEKSFQEKRIENTGGQLELQIRQAKLAMIDERISSKELKLEEMIKTREELEKKMAVEKKKEEKRKEKEAASPPPDDGSTTQPEKPMTPPSATQDKPPAVDEPESAGPESARVEKDTDTDSPSEDVEQSNDQPISDQSEIEDSGDGQDEAAVSSNPEPEENEDSGDGQDEAAVSNNPEPEEIEDSSVSSSDPVQGDISEEGENQDASNADDQADVIEAEKAEIVDEETKIPPAESGEEE